VQTCRTTFSQTLRQQLHGTAFAVQMMLPSYSRFNARPPVDVVGRTWIAPQMGKSRERQRTRALQLNARACKPAENGAGPAGRSCDHWSCCAHKHVGHDNHGAGCIERQLSALHHASYFGNTDRRQRQTGPKNPGKYQLAPRRLDIR
jgi:hypothetical protein